MMKNAEDQASDAAASLSLHTSSQLGARGSPLHCTPQHPRMRNQDIDVLLSARSSTAITLAEVDGEMVIAALGGDDAAAHLRVGDTVLSVNGRAPGRTPSNWKDDSNPSNPSASVLMLRVRRPDLSSTASSHFDEQTSGDSAEAYAHVGSFGGYGLSEGLYSLPANMLPLPGGGLVVSDGGGCRLQFVSPLGELHRAVGSRGTADGLFNYPSGLAVDRAGEVLYVADRGNCRVQKLRVSDGGYLGSTAAFTSGEGKGKGDGDGAGDASGEGKGDGDGSGAGASDGITSPSEQLLGAEGREMLNYPWGVALSHGDTVLLVSDMRGRLCALDAQTLRLLCVHTPRCGLGSPHAMAVSADELFIADHDHHRVVVLGLQSVAAAAAAAARSGSKDAPHSSVPAPLSPADDERALVDGAGRFFTGTWRSFGGRGGEAGRFQHPVGLAVVGGGGDDDSCGGARTKCQARLLLVSEFTGRRVQGLDATNGAPLFVLPAPSGTRLLGVAAAPLIPRERDADADDAEHQPRARSGEVGWRIYAGDFDLDRIHFWEPPAPDASIGSVAALGCEVAVEAS